MQNHLVFCVFHSQVKTQFYSSIHIQRSDIAKKCMSKLIQSYMRQNGFLHHASYADTPSQNKLFRGRTTI